MHVHLHIIVFLISHMNSSKAFTLLSLLCLITGLPSAQAQSKVAYLAEFNTGFDLCELHEMNISYGTKIGNIVTLNLDQEDVQKLHSFPRLLLLKKAAKVYPELKRAIPDLRADSVCMATELETGYTGKDVIIGVTDWGFDYTHPMFYDTALQETRILAAWDQFKTSGPHPAGYSYGTMHEGTAALMQAEKDTFNVYDYATHGSHVAGIAGGGGAGIGLKGVAYDANFLMVTFLINEAAVIDGIAWMKKKADQYKKRLVINMSWGLYNFGTLDGTSLLSKALDSFSNQGVVFVTSGGNNGGVNFHIKKDFNQDSIQTRIDFYPFNAHPHMWGQSISMWGEQGKPFSFQVLLLNGAKQTIYSSKEFNTSTHLGYFDTSIIIGLDTFTYNLSGSNNHPHNNNPNFQLRVQDKRNKFIVGLKSWSSSGTVHYYNLVELTNGVGNWGLPFTSIKPGWLNGDNAYGLGEPASNRSVITVAAHVPEIKLQSGQIAGGGLANFSSRGPTIDERSKPDISGPGVDIESSISSFTTRDYTLTRNVNFKGKDFPMARFSGTSMSSPATAGVVAMMLQANSSLSAEQVKFILKTTARQDLRTGVIGDTASKSWGWGKVNALAAVQMAERMRPSIPSDSVPPKYQIYPNPAKDKLFFSGDWNSVYTATLYDLKGKIIITGMIGSHTFLPLGHIQDGFYLLKIEGFSDIFRVVLN